MGKIEAPFWCPAEMDAFILDWDGVLANTKLDFMPIRRKYFGGEIVPLIESAEALPPDLCAEVKAEIRRVEMEGAARSTAVDGAFELLEWLNANGKRYIVVSRNCLDSIMLAAQTCGITLPSIVMSRETGIVKPDPRALLMAADKMDTRPGRCVMLGDFVYDMLGARRAGTRAVLVEGDASKWGHLADASFDTMRGFVEELRSPRPLVMWEYSGMSAEHLLKVNEEPKPASSFAEAAALLRSGVTRVAVPEKAKLSVEEWMELDISCEYIDMPLYDVLCEVCAKRWPASRIIKNF